MIGQTIVNIYQFPPSRTREFYCFPITGSKTRFVYFPTALRAAS